MPFAVHTEKTGDHKIILDVCFIGVTKKNHYKSTVAKTVMSSSKNNYGNFRRSREAN